MSAMAKQKSGNKKIVVSVVLALTLAGTAIYLANDKTAGTYEEKREETPQLFTDFKPKINSVSRISMRSKGQDFVIEKIDSGEWVMPERFNYPVQAEKVRSILLNAAELEILEKKTNDPDKLDKIGLGSPDKKESDAVRVSFFDDSGTILSNFIAGKRRLNGGYSLYVRQEHDNQAYLVKGDGWMRLELGPNYWLGAERFFLGKDEVKRVEISRKDGDTLIFEREHSGARKFRVDGLPDGKEDDASAVNATAFAPAELSLAGVVSADAVRIGEDATPVLAAYTTFGGLRMIYDMQKDHEGDYLLQVNAETTEKASDAVKDRATRINAAAAPWRYVISPESVEKMTVTPADVVKKPKEKS